jgi:WD40 repeat protein
MSDEPTSATTTAKPEVMTQRRARHALPTGALDIAIDPDGQHVYTACMDGVYRVDAVDGQPQRLTQHASYVSGVVLDPARPALISAGYDGQLIWYDLRRGVVYRRVQAHSFWSWKLAISPDGRFLASASGQYLAGGEKYEPAAEREPSVKVFDVASGDLLHAFSHVPPVQSVAISPDSHYLAAGNLMGEIRVWDVAARQQVAQWTTGAFTSWGIIKSHCYIGGIHALHFGRDGQYLYAAGMGPMRDPMAGNGRQLWQQFAWQESPARTVDETHAGDGGEGLMETLSFHPQQPLFLMGGRLRGGQWNAAIFSSQDGARVHHLNTGFRLTSSAFDASGNLLYLAGMDKQSPPKNGEYPPFGLLEIHELGGS